MAFATEPFGELGHGWPLGLAGRVAVLARPEVGIEHLHGGPWTRLGEGGQGEAGLSSRLAAGTWIGAAGSSLLAGPQRRIALQQGLRLGAGSPDGVHPRMAPGVPLRLVTDGVSILLTI